jgi:uncharacterized protein (DUF427 family)
MRLAGNIHDAWRNDGEQGAKDSRCRSPITITPNPQRLVVKIAGQIVADTRNALTLVEASYGPVQYIPRSDVDMSTLERSEHTTYCPYKGECAYYSAVEGRPNVAWTYEEPYESVTSIKNYLAFYADRVDLP